MSTDKYKHALIDPQLMMGHAPSKPKVRHIGADVRKCVNDIRILICTFKVLARTVKGNSQGALSQWLQTATPDGNNIIINVAMCTFSAIQQSNKLS